MRGKITLGLIGIMCTVALFTGCKNGEVKTNVDVKTTKENSIKKGDSVKNDVKEYKETITMNINEALYDGKIAIILPTNEEHDKLNIVNYAMKIEGFIRMDLKIPVEVIKDEEALERDLSEFTIFAYGTMEGNKFLNHYKDQFRVKVEDDYIEAEGKRFDGTGQQLIAITENPYNNSKGMVIYTAQNGKDIININDHNHGLYQYYIFKDKKVIAEENYTQHIESKKIIKDIDYLYEQLPKLHKNLYHKISKEEFKKQIDDLKLHVSELSKEEIVVELSRIVASVGDGHTVVVPDGEKFYPYKCYWFEDGISVIQTISEYKDILNKQIIEINEIPIKDVIEKLKSIIAYENESYVKSMVPEYMMNYEIMKGLNITEDGNLKLKVRSLNGEESIVNVKAVRPSQIPGERFINDIKKVPLHLSNQMSFYWYRYIEENKVLYFNYSSCMNMNGKSIQDIIDEIMEFIDKEEVDKIIVDMRNNRGGDSRHLNPFIEKIARSKYNHKGKLFVVVGRKTFSSAVLNTLSFHKHTEALFYGEGTGGKPNHFGEVKRFKLPETEIEITYSTKYFSNYEKDIDTFIPDEVIESTLEEFIEGKDIILEKILEYK